MTGRNQPQSATVEQWLTAHEAGVPDALRTRLHQATQESGRGAVPDELAQAGERLLAGVLDADMTRAHALDVLGADALLTYAFEAAAEEPSQLASRADAAMQRIAALAEKP